MVFKRHSHLQGELERKKITLYLETILLRGRLVAASLSLLFIMECVVCSEIGADSEVTGPSSGLQTRGQLRPSYLP